MLQKIKSCFSGKKLSIFILFVLSLTFVYADFTFVNVTDLHVEDSWGLGDGDMNGEAFFDVMTQVQKLNPKPAFVIASGDLSDSGNWANPFGPNNGMYPALTQHLFPPLQSNPGIGDYHVDPAQQIPIFFIPGNHDYRLSNVLPTSDKLLYYGKHISPTVTLSGNRIMGQDYVISIGNALIYCLDSGWDVLKDTHWQLPEGSGLRTAQKNWLINDMSKPENSNKKKIIVLHHPPANGIESNPADGSISENRDEFLQLCEDYNVDITLAGHTHNNYCNDRYGNWISNTDTSHGTRHFQTGTTMDGTYRVITVKSNAVNVANHAWSPYMYDADNNQNISYSEVMQAINDYYDNKISYNQVVLVINAYYNSKYNQIDIALIRIYDVNNNSILEENELISAAKDCLDKKLNLNDFISLINYYGNQTEPEEIPELPQVYSLSSNYPNPFNPTTTINYALPKASNVILKVFNIKGQFVKTLINEQKETGNHSVVWNGKDNNNRKVASGVYFYRINAGEFTDMKKMLLIK